MKKIATLILTIFWITTLSQTPPPGPGTGMVVWLQAQSKDGQTNLTDVINNRVLASQPTQLSFNFNPAFAFSGSNEIKVDIADALARGKSVFVVFRPHIGSEQCIYSFDDSNQHQLMLTTHRMAELTRIQYMNFPSPAFPYPQLNTYLEGGIGSNQKASRFSLGTAPAYQNLPANGFSGAISEVLIYDSMMSPEEKHQVESYLAIKYGLTLQNAIAPLVNLQGKNLWCKPIKPDFNHHLTVIGMDPEQNFFQPISQSTLPGDHLTLEFKDAKVVNEGYIAIRNNGLPFLYDENHRSLRLWSASSLHATDAVTISWKEKNSTLPSGWDYWLRIDTTGATTFHPLNTKHIPVKRQLDKWKSHPFLVDQDGSGDDVIQIVRRPKAFVDYAITTGACGSETSSFDFKVIGELGPYTVHIKNNSETIFRETIMHHNVITVNDLSTGPLSIMLTDQAGHTTEELVYVNDFNPGFKKPGTLKNNMALPAILDASVQNENIQYTWYKDKIILSTHPQLRVNQPGKYLLIVQQDGCIYQNEFYFQNVDSTPEMTAELFPNPSINGYFYTSVNMADPAPLSITVHTLDGRRLSTHAYPAAYQTEHIASVPGPGTYLITFQTDQHSITRKLIAQ